MSLCFCLFTLLVLFNFLYDPSSRLTSLATPNSSYLLVLGAPRLPPAWNANPRPSFPLSVLEGQINWIENICPFFFFCYLFFNDGLTSSAAGTLYCQYPGPLATMAGPLPHLATDKAPEGGVASSDVSTYFQ